ncbi:hypothetical protein C7212DRAFT_358601 [Tuber magnatum]|uniref:Nephrocystin 3-like N-terminal domain-containing protein n=1 Tax=Tuber magnatum TaxID=42249 RepID=A0A317SKS4_9PEZI|nr:hypothetical protein C7212DRAFT_358601 [Tuber magnatum]
MQPLVLLLASSFGQMALLTIGSGSYGSSTAANGYIHGAEILQCLYTSVYESHRGRVREPAGGTCTWVTEHPKYKDWLEKKTSGLLWLSADLGCGKSVIASFLVTHLKIQTNAIVCYFFFKDDSEEQKSAASALCAILHQLSRQRNTLCIYAEEAFKAKGKRFTKEVDTLWNILVEAVAEGGCGEVICVVDALNECEEETLAPLIRRVTRLPGLQTSDAPLKFLVTSRSYHKIERELGLPATTIRLKGEDEINAITADVTRVIDEGIKDLESYWGRANPEKARRILNIVVAAAKPLSLREVNVALRVRREHSSIKELGDLPGGFEKTVKNSRGLFVRVIDSKIYLHTLCPKDFNFIMADICISYLLLEEFENDPLEMNTYGNVDGYLEKYAFLSYAARQWADHFRDSQDRGMELFESTRLICEAGSKRFLTWFQIYWFSAGPSYRCPKDLTHLMVASWLKQGTVVERLLEEGGDINAKAYIGGKEYNILHGKRFCSHQRELELIQSLPIAAEGK